jgi:hypothetical protein
VTAFEDKNFFAGFGEVSGVDQAVVAAADDDCVVMLHAVKRSVEFEDDAATGSGDSLLGWSALVQGQGERRKRINTEFTEGGAQRAQRSLVFDRLPLAAALVVVCGIEIDSSE